MFFFFNQARPPITKEDGAACALMKVHNLSVHAKIMLIAAITRESCFDFRIHSSDRLHNY